MLKKIDKKLRKSAGKVVRKIKAKLLYIVGWNILKQEAMLRLALKEVGLNYRDLSIKIDHVNGKNFINGVELPVIYPLSFFEKAQSLKKKEKKYKFYFNGNMSNEGGRKKLLQKFLGKSSLIIESNYGRSFMTKSKFNFDYYNELSLAEFGLCPHQKNFIGSEKTMWTYRFIECCMVYTLPVTFIETPLGAEFTCGFVFYEDNHFDESDVKFNMILAKKNFDLAKERYTLSDEVVKSIINAKNK